MKKNSLFTEAELTETNSKLKLNYYLRDHLQNTYVYDALSKPSIRNKIIEGLGTYIDSHSEALSAAAPMYQMPFGEKEESFLYEAFKITPQEVISIFNDMNEATFDGKMSKMFVSFVKHSPAKVLVTAMLIDALQNGYDDMVECAEYLWAFIEYPLLFHTYWRHGVKKDVMMATLEDLGKRYTITKSKNVQDWLKRDMENLVDSFSDRLKTGADHIYTSFMQNCRNWLKSKFQNIADVYYKHNEANITQHTQVSIFDDGTINDQVGLNTTIMQISTATINKFANKEISDSIIKAVCEYPKVDSELVKNYINKIYSTDNNKIPQFVEAVITAYFTKYPTEMRLEKGQFISFGLMLYRSISTSKKEIYITIREVLDYWMNTICDINSYTNRAATRINYTRAIFNYMIFMISSYNN